MKYSIINLNKRCYDVTDIRPVINEVEIIDELCQLVIFNMSGCTYVNSGIIGIIIGQLRHRPVCIVVDTEQLHRQLDILCIDEIIPLFKTIEEAKQVMQCEN